jgi:short-subunit dehydrogenase involved in D-alanine esterification of teichoic acids
LDDSIFAPSSGLSFSSCEVKGTYCADSALILFGSVSLSQTLSMLQMSVSLNQEEGETSSGRNSVETNPHIF